MIPETIKVHDLKVWPDFFDEILAGTKTAEFRRVTGSDGSVREFKVGDLINFNSYVPTPAEWQAQMGNAEYPDSYAPRTQEELDAQMQEFGGPETFEEYYGPTGETCLVEIRHVVTGGQFGIPDDCVMLSIRKVRVRLEVV